MQSLRRATTAPLRYEGSIASRHCASVRAPVRRAVVGRAASGTGNGTDTRKSNMWESVRIVCDDGVVPASLEMLAMASPLLRSNIETAMQQMAPAPTQDVKNEDGGCYSIAQPLELQMQGTQVEEWHALLQLLYLKFPRPELDLNSIHKLLPLAHKVGMKDMSDFLDSQLRSKLPAALSMDPTNPGYMLKWLALADRLQLNQTEELCVESIRLGNMLGGSPQSLSSSRREGDYAMQHLVKQLYVDSFYLHLAGARKGQTSPRITADLKQLPAEVLVQLLEAASQVNVRLMQQ